MSRRNTRAYVVRCLLGSDSGYEKSNALELLDHFLDAEDSWIGSPRCQKIIQTHGIQLALSAPHFLHAILAFSANHLSSLLGSRGREYETAADLHYGLSLQGYVSEIQQLKVENADQIIGSCLLHSMLALLYFSHEKDNPEDIPDTEKCDLTWLRLLQASPIIRSDPRFRDSLRESVWLPVLTEYGIWKDNTDQSHSPDSRMTDSTSTLSPTKTSASPDTVDGLDDVGVDVPNEDLFSKEAMRLELLLAENVDHTRIDRLMLFAGTLQPNFIDLLYARDEKALFIIIHWLVLLLQVGQWWMSRSARFGLARICIFLYRSSGPEVRAMLELPAAQCGLRLSALDGRSTYEDMWSSDEP